MLLERPLAQGLYEDLPEALNPVLRQHLLLQSTYTAYLVMDETPA